MKFSSLRSRPAAIAGFAGLLCLGVLGLAWLGGGGASPTSLASSASPSPRALPVYAGPAVVVGEMVDPAAAPAPRPDPMLPIGVELCLPSEHYRPANPPVPAGVDPVVVIETLRARLAMIEAVERDLSVRWRGDPEQPFEAVFDFYRRGEGATFHHHCTLLQGADGRWRIIDYTVQRVSPREDEPVLVLTERSREWRELLRGLAAGARG